MNLAMELTLDGLVRALRYKAADLAETAQRRYPSLGNDAAQNDCLRPVCERRELGKDCHDSRGR